MKVTVAVTIILPLLSMLGGVMSANEEWMQISQNIAFQSKVDPKKNNAQMIRARNLAIDRMLNSNKKNSSTAVFDTSPFSVSMQDMNQGWDSAQLAWHLMGFYVDCNGNNNQDDHNRYLQEDQQKNEQGNEQGNKQEDHHEEEDDGDKTCTRKTMYAVYVDPNYQGGGIGEYKYYDQDSASYKCHSDSCRAKMDCHSENSSTWQLLGIFKIDKISQGDGWMEQLFKHAGVCYWGSDNYSFMAGMRETFPNGCKQTSYKANGNYLYLAIKPVQNANIGLALYTDSICSKLYTGNKNFDVYGAAGTSYSDVTAFNKLLNGYKRCQPCVAYNLTADDFSCSDDAGYTNCNQCMKFAVKAECAAATPREIKLAYRQSGMLSVGNISDAVEMTSLKRLESEVLFDVADGIPHYLEAAVVFFLGCLTFYCIPGGSGGSDTKKSPLLKGDDDGSVATADRSEYSISPPISPSGIVLDCDPMRPQIQSRRSWQRHGSFNMKATDADLDGQDHYESSNIEYSSDQDGSEDEKSMRSQLSLT